MKTMREAYFENFRKERIPNQKGNGFRTSYRYTGKWLYWDLTKEQCRKEKILFALLEGFSVVIYLVSAMQKVNFNTQRLSSGLFTLALIPWIAEIWGVIRLIAAKKKMMVSDFDGIRDCITIGSTVRIAFLAAALIAASAVLVSAGKLDGMSIAAGAGHLISGAASFIIFRRYTSLPYEYS